MGRELVRLLHQPRRLQPLPQGARAPDGIRLPQRLLGFHGCYSTCARGLGLILCGREFRLSVRELGGQLIDSPAQLLSLSAIGARRVRVRAAVRLLKLLEQGGRRFRGTLLRLW
jgi:hypothetical protein